MRITEFSSRLCEYLQSLTADFPAIEIPDGEIIIRAKNGEDHVLLSIFHEEEVGGDVISYPANRGEAAPALRLVAKTPVSDRGRPR